MQKRARPTSPYEEPLSRQPTRASFSIQWILTWNTSLRTVLRAFLLSLSPAPIILSVPWQMALLSASITGGLFSSGRFEGRYVVRRGVAWRNENLGSWWFRRASWHYGPRWCADEIGTGARRESEMDGWMDEGGGKGEGRGGGERERDRRKRWWRWRSGTAINTELAEQNHPSTTRCAAFSLAPSSAHRIFLSLSPSPPSLFLPLSLFLYTHTHTQSLFL